MRRAEVLSKLKETEPILRAKGVGALYLFGSHARDEAAADSDIDVFVDPISNEQFGFLQFMEAYETIRKVFGAGVELGYSTRDGLSRYVRKDIEQDAVRVF